MQWPRKLLIKSNYLFHEINIPSVCLMKHRLNQLFQGIFPVPKYTSTCFNLFCVWVGTVILIFGTSQFGDIPSPIITNKWTFLGKRCIPKVQNVYSSTTHMVPPQLQIKLQFLAHFVSFVSKLTLLINLLVLELLRFGLNPFT